MKQKICKRKKCRKEFVVHASHQKFCCKKCQIEHYQEVNYQRNYKREMRRYLQDFDRLEGKEMG